MIVDGRAIADSLYASLGGLSGARLGILVGDDTSATRSFVSIKERAAARLGVAMIREELHAGATTADAIARVQGFDTGAVLVQLPLMPGLDAEAVLRAIPRERDVDGTNPDIPYQNKLAMPPVSCAVMEILQRSTVDIVGKKTVVVGNGRLVGAPAGYLLERAGARVVFVTKESGSLDELADADIIVSGAGSPALILPGMIRDGVVLIDAGTSELGGKIAGDAHPDCASKCSIFTPTPGGVGPVAVAMIFKNLEALIRKG